jgi:hypothetical protein
MKINTKLKAGVPRNGCGTPPTRPIPLPAPEPIYA